MEEKGKKKGWNRMAKQGRCSSKGEKRSNRRRRRRKRRSVEDDKSVDD